MSVEEFYNKYKERLYKYVYKRISNKSDVDDIVQDTVLKITNNMDFYNKNKGKFSNFILLNANQVIIDYYRRTISRDKRNENLDDKDYKSNYDYFENIDEEYGLDKIISKLPKSQREVIELVYMNGLSYRDCSRLLGKSESSVKSLLFRARNNLKKIIEEENPEIVDRYFGRKLLKIIVLSLVSVGMITGLAYAIIRFYNVVKEKETYTINELREKVPEDLVDISRTEALELIQKYDNIILERELSYTEDDLELVKNYKLDKICWKYKCEDYQLYIDANSGKFMEYKALTDNKILLQKNITNILSELLNMLEYELEYKNEMSIYTETVYAKKYNQIFNNYESITIISVDNLLSSIIVLDCEYSDVPINIKKENAIKICKKMGKEPKIVNMAIENVNSIINNEKNEEKQITMENVNDINICKTNYKILKVWKIELDDGKVIYLDVVNGDIYE